MSYGTNFKAGGNAEAQAQGYQFNVDPTYQANVAEGLGVANPDIQSDNDLAAQMQDVQAGALGGSGGQDNVHQTINV